MQRPSAKYLGRLQQYNHEPGIETNLAEKEGFEPPVPFLAHLISSQAHSATLSLLLRKAAEEIALSPKMQAFGCNHVTSYSLRSESAVWRSGYACRQYR